MLGIREAEGAHPKRMPRLLEMPLKVFSATDRTSGRKGRGRAGDKEEDNGARINEREVGGKRVEGGGAKSQSDFRPKESASKHKSSRAVG